MVVTIQREQSVGFRTCPLRKPQATQACKHARATSLHTVAQAEVAQVAQGAFADCAVSRQLRFGSRYGWLFWLLGAVSSTGTRLTGHASRVLSSKRVFVIGLVQLVR